MNCRTLLTALVSTLIAAVAVASTPNEAVVVVPLDEGSARETLAIERVLNQWVERSPLVDLADVARIAQGPALEEMESRLEQARSVRDSGIDAYDMMNYESALMRLERAIESYEQSDLTTNLDELLDTYFMRALALFYEGQPSRARNQILDIYALKRDFTPDRGRVTPEIEGLIEDGRRAADEAPPTTLEIQTEPVPALIFVDGRYRGVSPVEVTDLQPGHHFVSVRAPGYAFVQERHLAAPGQIARIRLDFTASGREFRGRTEGLRISLQGNDPAAAAMALAEWADSSQVLAVGVKAREGGVSLVGWRFAADGHLIAHAEARVPMRELEQSGEISRFMDALHGTERPRGPEGEPIPELNPSRGLSFDFDFEFNHKTIGMISTGVGAGVALGAVFVGLSAGQMATDAREIPQLDVEDYEAAMGAAKSRALIADSMYVTAALAMGAGVFLVLQDEAPWNRGDGMRASLSVGYVPGVGFVSVGGRF